MVSSKIQWTDHSPNPLKREDGGNYYELTTPGGWGDLIALWRMLWN